MRCTVALALVGSAALLAVAGRAGPAAAQLPGFDAGEAPFQITADSLEYESDRDLYVARGSVVLTQGDDSIRADWVTFSNATQRGVASGNVVITDGDETLYTRFVEFDIRNLRGVLFDGRFAASGEQFRLEGAEIAKTGEDHYRFVEGMFTTCRCPDDGRDPWRIRADEADLEIGGYGTARNTTFDILGVPVVWLPWMIYPLKTERQSGFLLPDLAYGSRNGVAVGLPFFWAAAENLNVTATPRWLQKRGFKGDLELEYLPGEESWIELFGAYIHDEKIDPNSREEPYGADRWTVIGRQELHLPLGVVARSDVSVASDNDYVIDFDELRDHRNDRYLESIGFAGRSLGSADRFGLVGSVEFADDLQSPDDRDRDKYMLQRLPNLDVAALPGKAPSWLSWLVPSADVQYTYFEGLKSATGHLPAASVVGDRIFLDTGIDALPNANEQGSGGSPAVDADRDDFLTNGGPEGDGIFQEGEPLADRGHRVRVVPRLAAPLRIADALELYPEVGWHQMLYDTDAQGGEEWGVLMGRADLRTRFGRTFAGGTRHVAEPRVGWALLGKQNQSGEPLFVPRTAVPQDRVRQLDLDNVVLDPADRKRRFNGLTWGIANRIFGPAGEGGVARLLADFEISGGYAFHDDGFSDLFLDGSLHPLDEGSARFNLGFDPERGRLDEALAELLWASEAGHAVSFGYRFLRQIPEFYEDFRFDDDRFDHFERNFDRINQLNFALRVALTQQWAVSYRVAYSFENSLLLSNQGGIEYFSRCRCWAVRLEARQDRVRDVQFNLVYSLTGLGKRAYGAGFGDVGLP